jgi:LCP family protein required for cell wall assembly
MPKTKPTPPRWRRVVSGFVFYPLCILALLIGTLAGWIHTSKPLQGIISDRLFHRDPVDVFHTHMFTVLLLGCDEDRVTGGASISRESARSDMMLLAQVDFDKHLITGLSIPRDTLVGFGKYKERKINAYHAMGGDGLAKQAVEALLPGTDIDKVVDLDFEGFDDMVDAVDGVPIDVEKNMDYVDKAGHLYIHLKKGPQLLTGKDAEGYVRFRHADSDFARADRQHHFMLAFKDQVAKHPFQLTKVVDAIAKMLADGMTPDEVGTLGNWVSQVPKQDIKFGSLPVYDVPHYNLRVKKSELHKTLVEYDLIEHSTADSVH